MTSLRNIKITIAYDGTDYVGWQVQPNGPTIQAALEKALLKLTGETRRIMGSGRTDSGVHAVGQVAAFQTESSIPARKFQRGLQTFLPDDIQIRSSCEVHEQFHATHWAIRKHYRYLICNSKQMSPFWRRYVHQFHGELDFWRWFVDKELAYRGGHFSSPMYNVIIRPPRLTIFTSVSKSAFGGYCLQVISFVTNCQPKRSLVFCGSSKFVTLLSIFSSCWLSW